MWAWEGIAWQWPYIVGTLAKGLTTGLLILGSVLITRWWTTRNLEPLLPEKARAKINDLATERDHYKRMWEEERDRAGRYAAVIKASVATASHTLINLQGTVKEK